MKTLKTILAQLDSPINRQATQILDLHQSLEGKSLFSHYNIYLRANTSRESKRQEILRYRRELLRWLSSMSHKAHHKAAGTGFLPDSGKWLQDKKEFLEWRKSSVSSVLWLRGIRECYLTDLIEILTTWLTNI